MCRGGDWIGLGAQNKRTPKYASCSTRVPRPGDALSAREGAAVVTNETHLARSARRTVSSTW